jgi:predicted RND superfamily exporter protein
MAVIPEFGFGIAAGALLVLTYFVIQRLRSDDDPSLQHQTETATGSASILLSGVHVTAMLAMVAAMGLFVAGLLSDTVLLVLLLVVAAHWIIEKREAMSA